ncbi:PREDICTED: uncharacterized protein LOC104742573 isoform X2 [Camelina sativa]|uniref:Uncharacterized protein LOC104742573 isoform X2 n=1 Tax=Camelina sativa TaxID=90675 RepID=A0ABM0VW05_CAMSA|nr:PREDICTED: uncharacterized protein LOC104742573 isoform X2 [Camelina sativa]
MTNPPVPPPTVENGGVEPNMLAFIEDVYKSKKTGKIVYKKAKQIVETLKEQVNDLQSKEPLEDGLVQPLSCPEINDLVRKAIPKKKVIDLDLDLSQIMKS